jgi:hypothetical protein
MAIASPLRLVEHCFELAPQQDLNRVPANTRGMYVLYKKQRAKSGASARFNVVYIGIASGERAGIRGRLSQHRRRKGKEWSHFSVFSVWPNIRNEEVKELEGLFRHIYRLDAHANRLNIARTYIALTKIRRDSRRQGWMKGAATALPVRRKPMKPRRI